LALFFSLQKYKKYSLRTIKTQFFLLNIAEFENFEFGFVCLCAGLCGMDVKYLIRNTQILTKPKRACRGIFINCQFSGWLQNFSFRTFLKKQPNKK